MRRCAQNPLQAEFSLCGNAFDAFDSGDADEPHEIANAGQVINCEDCCRAIREVKAMRNTLRPRSEWLRERHLELAKTRGLGDD